MPGVATWAEPLESELALLNRWFEGRFVTAPAAGDEVVPAEQYRQPQFLEAAIARARTVHVAALGAGHPAAASDDGVSLDLRIAISRFTRQYASSLSALALVSLANGIGLNVAASHVRFVVRSNVPFQCVLDTPPEDIVRSAARPTTWSAEGPELASLAELRAWVWQRLYGEHLAPLFDAVQSVARVSPSLIWSNAAEWVALVADTAEEYLSPVAARPYVADRRALLAAASIPGVPGPNPMSGLISWEQTDAPDLPRGVPTRRVCCVTYLLADRLGRLCQNCPFLPLEARVALIRERHGVAMGETPGPAALRSIEVGLAKIGRRPAGSGGRGRGGTL